MTSTNRWSPALVALLVVFGSSWAAAEDQELPEWIKNTKISGYFFGDAFGVLAHHDPAIEGENGFWVRRVYLTVDTKTSESTDVRVRFEANSSGDFTSNLNMEPYIKDLYLRWKYGRHEAYFGLSSAPTFDLIENHWGYRQVEKTPLDLYRWAASRDIGVAMKGALDEKKRLRYHVMLGNGEGTKSESNDGKKAMASVSFHPSQTWTFELYADADNRPGQADRWVWQAFAGYKTERARFGLQYAAQERETSATTELELDVASAYGAIKSSDRTTWFGRLDRNFDPIPDANLVDYISFDNTARWWFALVGVDVALTKKISLIPNLEGVSYDAVGGGTDPDSDLIARLTLFAQF